MRKLRVLLCILLVIPLFAHAAEQQSELLSVEPVVIDEKGQARDIIKQTITIVNTSEQKLTLYPSVNNVDVQDGKQDFVSAVDSDDRAASLANWIELSRGVIELGPGEEKVIPFVIRINMNGIPGSYHAKIAFGYGSSRSAAENNVVGSVMVNLEVQKDVKEIMQLNKFSTDNFYFSGDDVLFNYQLQNIGNQELAPRGEIRIYNRRGEEVASVGVNEEGKAFAPDQLGQLASVWSASDGFGRYKAFLTVDYGQGQGASVQDTVFFWIIPWKQLLALAIVSLIAVIFFALYFHRWFEARHLMKLAGAGVLTSHPAIVEEAVAAKTPRFSFSRMAGTMVSPFVAIAGLMPRVSFRKAEAVDTDDADAEAEQAEEAVAEAPAPAERSRSLRSAFEQDAAARASVARPAPPPAFVDTQWGTIDLKRRREERRHEEPSHGHVINLKRK